MVRLWFWWRRKLEDRKGHHLKAYGEPTVETVPRPGQKNMIYDAIGVDFRVYDSGGAIREMLVFPPGTAKNIWKF
jgi:hypothetical protein